VHIMPIGNHSDNAKEEWKIEGLFRIYGDQRYGKTRINYWFEF
jgi:hypothetical protein